LEANSGTLTLSNFNAVAGKAYKLKFKKGTTYSSVSVSLGNVTKTVNPDLVGDITDYYYCTATGALTFAVTVGSIPDIFQYIDNIELYAITSGTMQVVGDLFVHGTLHADGVSAGGTALDGRQATNFVDLAGHAISNALSVGVRGDATSASGEVRFYNDQGFLGSMMWDCGKWVISNRTIVLSMRNTDLEGGSLYGIASLAGVSGQNPSNLVICAGDKSEGSPERGGNLVFRGGTFYGAPTSLAYSGYMICELLPTNDPGVLDALWRSGSNLYISTGP
jgi:hypothetical protein